MSETLWKAAHARLETTRQTYLRATDDRVHGRPCDGRAAKYLVTGLAKCGSAAAHLRFGVAAMARADSGRRFSYACSSYFRRGKSICPNKLEVPLDATDAEVIAAVQGADAAGGRRPQARLRLGGAAEATPGAGAIDSGQGAALETGVQSRAVQGQAGRAVLGSGVDRSAPDRIGPGLSRAGTSPKGVEDFYTLVGCAQRAP